MVEEAFAFIGGLWSVQPVSAQPTVTLVRWRVVETELGERHFVGFNLDDREGRVSSKIEKFDPSTCRGVTRSGRIYCLSGDCGHDLDAEYVWQQWARINSVAEEKDVTSEISELIREANAAGIGVDR